MAMPCGTGAGGMPIGMQLIGPPFSEEAVLRAGDAYERSGAFTPAPPAL
jgi:aspartyl-tRNA(Asn)/glutamyl-tRNA(Gln) amidotransferase subunit A